MCVYTIIPYLFARAILLLQIPETVRYIAIYVAYFNSSLNPILYVGLNDNSRKAIKELITCSMCRTNKVAAGVLKLFDVVYRRCAYLQTFCFLLEYDISVHFSEFRHQQFAGMLHEL